MIYLKWWKRRSYNQEYSTQQDSHSDLMDKSKAFQRSKSWREFSTTRPVQFSSVQFSRSVVSNSFWPHGLQHTRLPCPSPTLGACSNSCPQSRWCHPTISSSVIPFSSYLQSFQHQGLFQWVRSSHQVAKVLEFQLQHQYFQWIFRTDFLLDWLVGPPCSPRDAQEFLQHHSSKASILWHSAFFMVQLSHLHMTTRKSVALTIWTSVGKVISLLFNMLSRLVIAFFPRSKHLSI